MDADKRKIWVDGRWVEVTDAVYDAYRKGDRKSRYFEKDLKTERAITDKDGRIVEIIPSREDSLERLTDVNAAQFSAQQEGVEDFVLRRLTEEQLHSAVAGLPDGERQLIIALFFHGMTEQDYADQIGISKQAVNKRKNKILKKLKKFLGN